MAQMVKNLPAVQESWVQFPGWEDPLEKAMATHSSIHVWRIPMDRGTWQATVQEVSKSQTQLSDQAQYREDLASQASGQLEASGQESGYLKLSFVPLSKGKLSWL